MKKEAFLPKKAFAGSNKHKLGTKGQARGEPGTAQKAPLTGLMVGESDDDQIGWRRGKNSNEHDHDLSDAKEYLKSNYSIVKQFTVRRAEIGWRGWDIKNKDVKWNEVNKSKSYVNDVNSAIKYLGVKKNPLMSGSVQVSYSLGYTWTVMEDLSKGIAVLYYQDRGMGSDGITLAAKDKESYKNMYQVFVDAGVIVPRAKKPPKSVTESVIIGPDESGDWTNPQVQILGGGGSYTLDRLYKKARSEAEGIKELIDSGEHKKAAYHLKQFKNTVDTIVAAKDELSKRHFGESISIRTNESSAEKRTTYYENGSEFFEAFEHDAFDKEIWNPGDRVWRGYVRTDDGEWKLAAEYNMLQPDQESESPGWGWFDDDLIWGGDRTDPDKWDHFGESKQRLDPKCWKGYRKQGTKMKDGVRVNNCVKVKEEWEIELEDMVRLLKK